VTGTHPFTPDWCIAPGVILAEWLEKHHLTRVGLAVQCAEGRPDYLPELVRVRAVLNREPMTNEDAVMLARGTGTDIMFWLRAEETYRDGLAAGLEDLSD